MTISEDQMDQYIEDAGVAIEANPGFSSGTQEEALVFLGGVLTHVRDWISQITRDMEQDS